MRKQRNFVAYYHFNSFTHWSLGLHVCLESPNLEIHVPFGMFRIGWTFSFPDAICWGSPDRRTWGLKEPVHRRWMTAAGVVELPADITRQSHV